MAEPTKGLDLVVLDQDRRVLVSDGHLSVFDVAHRLIETTRPDIVCIDSPPAWSSFGPSRAAERALTPMGISSFATGQDPGDHPFYAWMREGFALFIALDRRYPRYRGGAAAGTAAEVYPEATADLLAGRRRGVDEAKHAFRAVVLTQAGVPINALPTPDRIDAALAALTGLIALEGGHSWVGEPDEGVILLPVPVLPSAPLARGAVLPPGPPTQEQAPEQAPEPAADPPSQEPAAPADRSRTVWRAKSRRRTAS